MGPRRGLLPHALDGRQLGGRGSNPEFDPASHPATEGHLGPDLTVGGADLVGQAITAGLVDEYHLFLHPILVGGGKKAIPDGITVQLELLDERRFGSGVVHLHYAVSGTDPGSQAGVVIDRPPLQSVGSGVGSFRGPAGTHHHPTTSNDRGIETVRRKGAVRGLTALGALLLTGPPWRPARRAAAPPRSSS